MKNLNLKDTEGRKKSEKLLIVAYNILSFQREKILNVYKALKMTGKVHFTFLR